MASNDNDDGISSSTTPATSVNEPTNAAVSTATARSEEGRNTFFDWHQNSKLIKEWRAIMVKDIESGKSAQAKDRVLDSQTVFPCEYTFLDLGANVGDTIRKLIDSGLPALNGKQHEFEFAKGGLGDVQYGQWIGKRQMYESFQLSEYIQKKANGILPEDFCYYGVEGNPTFTARLREIEIAIMNLYPRPLRHAHFFTDHVATGVDGPTTLYLDTVNHGDNYWGSSIFQSHHDVQRSGKDTGVPVTGITLTTLLRETLKSNGHAIIKIDIEGAEFALIDEAIKSNVLCEFCQDRNATINVQLELHKANVMRQEFDPNNQWSNRAFAKLRECGVVLTEGDYL